MQDCKYRLPCNWCDKFNKFCDMSESIEIKLPDPNNCEHDWSIEATYYVYPTESKNEYPRYRVKRVCRKCHAIEMADVL